MVRGPALVRRASICLRRRTGGGSGLARAPQATPAPSRRVEAPQRAEAKKAANAAVRNDAFMAKVAQPVAKP